MNLNNINYIFTGFIVVMCGVLSYFLLTHPQFESMGSNRRTILVCILIGYAAFRIFRTWKTIKAEKSKNGDV